MELKPESRLHGFVVRYAQPLPEIKATLYRMEHEKSGADLVWLDREDDNKTFAIAFKTIPQDDTGVFHILEHSVLCGSQKYPMKEPFVELLKSSLQTFLNAFTFPDKTMYPLSSRNNQDFLNLIDVYLDAVLHPLSVTDPHAFLQEGWHYELDGLEGELTCNGVVYNEMKGVYAEPDSVLVSEMGRLLFPDNCYSFEYGGYPEHITELTYETYLASHARYYHPSNARIVLDGSVDLDRVLEKVDSFLKAYDRLDVDADIPMQAPVSPEEAVVPYEIGPEEDGETKVILARGWVFGDYTQRETAAACSALTKTLCGSNTAPLKKALLDRGLAQEVEFFNDEDGMQQQEIVLIVRNTRREDKETIWQVVEETLTGLADNGLDHQQLHAVLNRLEFNAREKDFGRMPRGLGYAITMMGSWLYGGDPAQNLTCDELFRSLHDKVDQGWFEQLLRQAILDNPHHAQLCMIPSKTLGEEKRQAERERLSAVKAGWDTARIEQTLEQFQILRARQEREDTPEELASLPVLSLADIPEEAPPLHQRVDKLDGAVLLHQDVDTDGIVYLNLHFNMADLELDELCKIPLLTVLLGHLATQRHSAAELRRLIEERLGRFTASAVTYAKAGSGGTCTPCLSVGISMLDRRKAEGADLLAEVLQTTQFDDSKAIRDLLRQARLILEQSAAASGNVFAARRAAASLSAKGAVDDAVQGIRQLRWLQQAERSYEENGEALCRELEALCAKLFVRERVTLSLTGAMDEAWLSGVLADLPSRPDALGAAAMYPLNERTAEGFLIPADIGFAARCASLDRTYSGPSLVAAQLLTLGYLWNNVRVKGGAYGTSLSLSQDGFTSFTSYRDPRCGQSLECYNGAGAALRAFCDSGETLDKYIISTIGELEPLVTPRLEGTRAAAMYFSGRTQADRQRLRHEVLHTTLDDLRAFSETLDRLCADSVVCVIGGQTALDGCGSLLERRESLLC